MTNEPLKPEDRKREAGIPCGLKNIGNTCYFNSLLQAYYNIPGLVKPILEFKDDDKPLPPLREDSKNNQDPQDSAVAANPEESQFVRRLNTSRELIKELKVLFGHMTKSDKKYGDPTKVLQRVTDNTGRPVEIGNE